ncbi:peptidylprolyl isomerase [Paenibacillus sp. MBLB4367]|uniref:peptidylprolyl isomerase n=1 Tax=Paenibacillus sp. MBLB4367 TaxID=3384767 RepID=UPI003908109E
MLLNKSTRKRLLTAGLALTLVAGLLAGCGSKKKDEETPAANGSTGDPKEVVATYKDGKITRGEMDKFISTTYFFYPQYSMFGQDPSFQEYMLKQMTTMRLLSGQATDASKKEAADKTKTQIDEMKKMAETQEKGAWDKALKEVNVAEKDIEAYMKETLTVITDMNGKVTDEQAKGVYDQKLKDDAHAFDIATVSHILVMTKDPADQTGQKELRSKEDALKRAKEVKAKLDAGGDFAALAKEYSDDGGSKDTGGKYENERLATTQWVAEFKQAAIDQPVGKIGEPVETSFGYHVIKVDARSTETFDKVKEEMRSEVAGNMVNDYVEKELPKLDFKITLPQPSPSPSESPAASPAASVSPSPSASPASK